MYEGFEKRYPIETEGTIMGDAINIQYSKVMPLLPGARPMRAEIDPRLQEMFFTSWRDESLAWHLTGTIYAGLNPSPVVRIQGPDAAKFLKKVFVNNIDKFPIGSTKHGVICTDEGLVAAHGILMRPGEDTYETFWLSPHVENYFKKENEKEKYNATIENITDKRFLIQTQGPRSLEMIEDASGDDLHDLKFCRFRNTHIRGKEVRVLRFGMAGVLGYEVHGNIEDAQEVYMALIEAGKPYGIRRMGGVAYDLNHTPGGSVQSGTHFMAACNAKPADKTENDAHEGELNVFDLSNSNEDVSSFFIMKGSQGPDYRRSTANPIELGLEKIIDFSKDFYGRDALLEYKKNPKRGLVTLKWNPEDLADIYISQFRPDEEPYQQMDDPGRGCPTENSGMVVSMDEVYSKDGKLIGFTGGRTNSVWDRAMISLAVIELDQTELGNEVIVLWGDVGTRQKKVRATVSRYPYNDHIVNRSFDVETIPHPADKKK